MASTYLSKTFGTATNRKKWTFSAWIKRSTNSSEAIFSSYSEDTTSWYSRIADNGSGRFDFTEYSGSAYTINLRPNARQRDVNGWYHIVWIYDSAQSTPSDRVKYYINGEQITSWDASSFPTTFPTQNKESGINKAQAHAIGKNLVNPDGSYFNGYMAHFHFCDGYAYDASAFGETDATTGIWKPITEPSVTYGTNGFFLKFENSGSMGLDSSPNTNNFTVNGTLTQTVDTPSNVFATFNPLIPFGDSYSNGNNTHTTSSNDFRSAYSTLGVSSGKYYAECKMTNVSGGNGFGIANQESGVGLVKTNSNKYLGQDTNDVALFQGGSLYNNGSTVATYGTISANDIVQIALDVDNGYIYWGINGTWQNSANPVTGTGGYALSNIGSNGTYFIGTSQAQPSVSQINFGNGYFGTTAVSSATSDESGLGIFEYTVPSGYYALCTKNINEQEYD